MKSITTYWLGSIALVFLLVSACTPTAEEPPQVQKLPEVLSLSPLGHDLDGQLRRHSTTWVGRTAESQNFDEAMAVIYEGYETTKVIYVPDAENDQLHHVYFVREGELQTSFMTIENSENSMFITTASGTISASVEENVLSNIEVQAFEHGAGRTECNPAKGFIDCTNAVQQTLIDNVGYVGALAFDIGCTAWIWCRGAFVVGCGAYAGVSCLDT
ncbi:MAG TPA: hypothetical protein DCP28_08135 [Cytophagales bacterium]|nr:hypothetical protein [Cytophagales bacterium]